METLRRTLTEDRKKTQISPLESADLITLSSGNVNLPGHGHNSD